jgi:hypothetical protein
MCQWAIYIFPGSVHIFSCSRIGKLIVRIYKSLTDTWMWKLGLWPHNSFSRNIFFKFSVLCLCSAVGTLSQSSCVSLAPAYDHKKAWASINRSNLSDWHCRNIKQASVIPPSAIFISCLSETLAHKHGLRKQIEKYKLIMIGPFPWFSFYISFLYWRPAAAPGWEELVPLPSRQDPGKKNTQGIYRATWVWVYSIFIYNS